MSDKESKFSELFENSKTEQDCNISTDVELKEPTRSIPATHYIENIDFDIIDPFPKSHKKSAVNSASLRRFKKNYSTIKKHSIDLHGYTRRPAIEELVRYIVQCQEKGILYFLVIFGKGLSSPQQPVLKQTVCSYLIQCQEVLAYEFAKPGDGGDGAAYVMLKKR